MTAARSRWMGLFVVLILSAPSVAADVERTTVTVVGTGKSKARPDIASVTLGVSAQDKSARDALVKNSATMTRVLAALKQRGIAETDIRTSQLSLAPQYTQTPTPRLMGFRAENSVTATLRKLDEVGEVIDGAVEAGANQVQGVWFSVEHVEKFSDEARTRAMEDARRKAEQLARLSGMGLGSAVKITEDGSGWSLSFQTFSAPMAAPAPGAPAPVAPGEEDVQVTVHVVFELLRPK